MTLSIILEISFKITFYPVHHHKHLWSQQRSLCPICRIQLLLTTHENMYMKVLLKSKVILYYNLYYPHSYDSTLLLEGLKSIVCVNWLLKWLRSIIIDSINYEGYAQRDTKQWNTRCLQSLDMYSCLD